MRIETFLGQVLRRGVTELLRSALRGLAAARSKPNSAEAYARRGMARYTEGDDDGAIADCAESIWMRPIAIAQWGGCNAYVTKGGCKEAIADLTAAIQLNQKFAEVYYLRSVAYAMLGDDGNAIADMIVADRLGLHDPEAREVIKGALDNFVSAWATGQCPPGLSEEVKEFLDAAAREKERNG